jgi:hypothetical protein
VIAGVGVTVMVGSGDGRRVCARPIGATVSIGIVGVIGLGGVPQALHSNNAKSIHSAFVFIRKDLPRFALYPRGAQSRHFIEVTSMPFGEQRRIRLFHYC